MGGSALTQLKAKLKGAGLSRNNSSGGKKERRSDPQVRAKKLAQVQADFNKFDTKHTKQKFDVGGRKIAGATGRPAQSKSLGIENRRKSLLPELLDRNRSGGIIDRRFGEDNPNLTPEEKALERFTRERQRKGGRATAFNLEDDEALGEGGLTHYGQSLGLGDGDVGLSRAWKAPNELEEAHEEQEEEGPARKKSKAEVMSEVIAKSKAYKADRQRTRDEDDDARLELDKDMKELRGLLGGTTPAPARAEPSEIDGIDRELLAQLIGSNRDDTEPTEEIDRDTYDRFVRELAYEPRLQQASNRLKTDEERALEAKQQLEAAERSRVLRMRGEEVEEANDGKRKRRRPQADDLDDDFVEEGAESYGLGGGLGVDQPIAYDVPETDEQEAAAVKLSDDEQGSEDDEEGDEEESGPDEEGSDDSAAGLDVEGLLTDEEGENAEVEPLVKPTRADKGKAREIAFTFPCPSTHDELLDILESTGKDGTSVSTVVQRIRTLYHPKLGGENKTKLEAFLGVLFDHVLYVCAQDAPAFDIVNVLIPHIFALSTSCPIAAAEHCVARLVLMQKNLTRGLAAGSLASSSKTWPGAAELTMLRVIGLSWSTSDLSHPVSAPAQLLIGQYLAQARVRNAADVASGLFLASLCMQYETISKRLVPEAVSFLSTAILLLFPHTLTTSTLPGSFPAADAFRSELRPLRVQSDADLVDDERADLSSFLISATTSTAVLARAALKLIERFAEMYVSLDAFIELFSPIVEILKSVKAAALPSSLQSDLTRTLSSLNRMLTLNNRQRRPLRLQQHRSVPIASHIPKFEEGGGGKRAFDPDFVRAEHAKLKALVKKEKKGAVRELRKDARFIAGERARMQREKDETYKRKIGQITHALQAERGDERKAERESKRGRGRPRGSRK